MECFLQPFLFHIIKGLLARTYARLVVEELFSCVGGMRLKAILLVLLGLLLCLRYATSGQL